MKSKLWQEFQEMCQKSWHTESTYLSMCTLQSPRWLVVVVSRGRGHYYYILSECQQEPLSLSLTNWQRGQQTCLVPMSTLHKRITFGYCLLRKLTLTYPVTMSIVSTCFDLALIFFWPCFDLARILLWPCSDLWQTDIKVCWSADKDFAISVLDSF